jgi:hypothetical protein
METNDTGELYLKRKLRISNFNDSISVDTMEYVDEPFSYRITNNGVESVVTVNEYYKKYVEENGKKYIRYYSNLTEDYFYQEYAGDNWKDLISKPQDRVSLGIIDVYKREYIFEKTPEDTYKKIRMEYKKITNPQGAYNSSEYLTKVLSIKAN